MWIGIISLFPEMFRAITDYGVTGRAVKNGLLSIESWSPRDFTHDRHRTVDDRPYGGGPGMLRIDERVIQTEIDEEWSIGDYVLSGGELPAMTLIDSVSRFIPGVLGHEASATEDSFADGLLDCPHYTRPEVLEEMEVPPVLLSGNHAEIRRWRLKQSLGRTWLRRPELLENLALTEEQAKLLAEFKTEHAQQQHKHDGQA